MLAKARVVKERAQHYAEAQVTMTTAGRVGPCQWGGHGWRRHVLI